jgi:hypothetical protein
MKNTFSSTHKGWFYHGLLHPLASHPPGDLSKPCHLVLSLQAYHLGRAEPVTILSWAGDLQ